MARGREKKVAAGYADYVALSSGVFIAGFAKQLSP
jgi:hypothetical protein